MGNRDGTVAPKVSFTGLGAAPVRCGLLLYTPLCATTGLAMCASSVQVRVYVYF